MWFENRNCYDLFCKSNKQILKNKTYAHKQNQKYDLMLNIMQDRMF